MQKHNLNRCERNLSMKFSLIARLFALPLIASLFVMLGCEASAFAGHGGIR